jgi:hypothetical protein
LARKRRKSGSEGGPREETAEGIPRVVSPQELANRKAEAALLSKRRLWTMALIAGAAVFTFGLMLQLLNRSPSTPAARASSAATFVGSETCAGCHQAEAKLWNTSQHKAAMQHATDNTVLGNFNDAGFDYFGVRSRFFRKDGKFLVETDDADGKLAVFEVKYTFGVDPL